MDERARGYEYEPFWNGYAWGYRRREEAELRTMDDHVLRLVDPEAPGNLQWLLRVYPGVVYRRLSHLLLTPLRQAIHDGPVALLRYFYKVARNSMRS